MVRTRFSLLAAALVLAFAGTGKAETISLFWQINGMNVITVPSSSTLTANIVLEVTSGDLTSIGWNISWDEELAYLNSTLVVAAGGVVPGTDWRNTSSLDASGSSPGTSPGTQRVYQFSADPGFSMTPGVATVGTITFHVTSLVDSDGSPAGVSGNSPGPTPISGDVSADFVDQTNGVGCTFGGGAPGPCTIINGASVNVPEPGTLALLALGLAGLAARRGRT